MSELVQDHWLYKKTAGLSYAVRRKSDGWWWTGAGWGLAEDGDAYLFFANPDAMRRGFGGLGDDFEAVEFVDFPGGGVEWRARRSDGMHWSANLGRWVSPFDQEESREIGGFQDFETLRRDVQGECEFYSVALFKPKMLGVCLIPN
jgi:hypothetical protein